MCHCQCSHQALTDLKKITTLPANIILCKLCLETGNKAIFKTGYHVIISPEDEPSPRLIGRIIFSTKIDEEYSHVG